MKKASEIKGTEVYEGMKFLMGNGRVATVRDLRTTKTGRINFKYQDNDREYSNKPFDPAKYLSES